MFTIHFRTLCPLLFFFVHLTCHAQDTLQQPQLSFEAYLDLYYAYDFNQPETRIRLPWVVDHNRHNEFNLNLGILAARLEHKRYRANLAMQAGTLVEDNYILESDVMQHVFDANAGVSLDPKGKLWIDAGIFGESHIGLESGIAIKNDVLSRSLVAEQSPYYLAGAKLSYEPNEYWLFSINVNNGWQRIARVRGNSLPGFGSQAQYRTDKLTLNWSTFICSEFPDDQRRMRYFNDLYAIWQLVPAMRATISFDFGYQQRTRASNIYDSWWGALAILHFDIDDRWSIAARGEYFHDPREVVVSAQPGRGLQTGGVSLNAGYLAFGRVHCRAEARLFISPEAIFTADERNTRTNGMVLLSMAMMLSKEFNFSGSTTP